jgi:hypothetical protein
MFAGTISLPTRAIQQATGRPHAIHKHVISVQRELALIPTVGGDALPGFSFKCQQSLASWKKGGKVHIRTDHLPAEGVDGWREDCLSG